MMKVCHIISGDLWAGAEVMVYYLLKNLEENEGLEISAILFNEGKLASHIRDLGIQVNVVDETKYNIFQIVREIKNIFIQRPPDIIHSHRYKENILAFLSSLFNKNIRFVCTQHGMPEYIGGNNKVKYTILHRINIYLLSKLFNKVIVVSKDMKDKFIENYAFSKDKITVIRNGTEIPENILPKIDEDIFIVGSMGRIFPVKDYPLMVEIAMEIKKETDNIHFELAGEGPDKAKIIDLIEKYQLGNTFILKGFVENIVDYYKGIDVYINTSIHEGIPMSVLEAMSYGIPIIAPDTGGIKEMICDGVEGYLVEKRDKKIFANKCLELFNDRSLRRSIGNNAREKAEKEFSNERMAKEYYNMYCDVVNT